MTVIGYTYEAYFHCPRHTEKRFPGLNKLAFDEAMPIPVLDKEGNEVRPVYDIDEPPENMQCPECLDEIVSGKRYK